MEVKTTQKYILMSPRKLREMVPLIRNLSVHDAVERLPFVKKRAAYVLRKAVLAAIASAKQKDLNEQDLVFKEIQIGEGPRLKRWRGAARGRIKPYKRRMSHIRVVLTTRTQDLKTKAQNDNPARTQLESGQSKKRRKGAKGTVLGASSE